MPGSEQRATGVSAHAHPALPVAPADPPVALTHGAADVPPATSTATSAATSTATFEPPRRNFPLLLAQGGSYGLAGKLASTNIVLPFLCAALGGSLIVAGLLVPLGILGTLVGYTLGPNVLASRLPSRTVMALATLGTATLLFALATIGVLFRDSRFTVDVTFLGISLGTGLLSGIGSIAFTNVLASAVQRERRRRLLFTQAALGGLLASVVAIISAWMFADRDPIVGHIALEWFAGGFLVVSAVCSLLVRVEHVPTRTAVRRSLVTTLRRGAQAARRYPWLREYLTQQILFLSVTLGTTFFSIRVAALHGSVPGSLAVIIAVTSLALVVGAVLWERVLTSRGFRGMLIGGTMCSALAAAGAVTVERLGLIGSPFVHALFILLATLANDAVSVAKSAFLVEHARPEELSELSAFTQLTIGVASAILAVAIAALAQVHGTVWPPMILLGLNLLAVGAAWRSRYGRPSPGSASPPGRRPA
jgi:MFS family permease